MTAALSSLPDDRSLDAVTVDAATSPMSRHVLLSVVSLSASLISRSSGTASLIARMPDLRPLLLLSHQMLFQDRGTRRQ